MLKRIGFSRESCRDSSRGEWAWERLSLKKDTWKYLWIIGGKKAGRVVGRIQFGRVIHCVAFE